MGNKDYNTGDGATTNENYGDNVGQQTPIGQK